MDASRTLVAKIPIRNERNSFWSADYPAHTKESLLPEDDQLRDSLLELVSFESGRGELTDAT